MKCYFCQTELLLEIGRITKCEICKVNFLQWEKLEGISSAIITDVELNNNKYDICLYFQKKKCLIYRKTKFTLNKSYSEMFYSNSRIIICVDTKVLDLDFLPDINPCNAPEMLETLLVFQ